MWLCLICLGAWIPPLLGGILDFGAIFSGVWSHVFMGETYFQEFGPKFSWVKKSGIWSQLLWVKNIFGNVVPNFMGENYFQDFGPRFSWVKHIFRIWSQTFWHVMLFLECHVLNVACHGVSISIVSISSVSCCVRILRVSVSMPCCGHPANQACLWGSYRKDIG